MLKKPMKNLWRVKQSVDQNLGRAEKTTVLNEDEKSKTEKVDRVKRMCQTVTKKIKDCLHDPSATDEKRRLKHIPEHALAVALKNEIEASDDIEASALSVALSQVAEVETDLAHLRLNSEIQIEDRVLAPFESLLDGELPAISNQRKLLKKLTLDMDSLKSRYGPALREGHDNAVSLRDDLDRAEAQVNTCLTTLTVDVTNFLSRESEYAKYLRELLQCQAEYHRLCLELIEMKLPNFDDALSKTSHLPVYGTNLEDHLTETGRDIAAPIELCISAINSVDGEREEGIFRLAGSINSLKRFKALLDAGMEPDESDVHVLAGALKLYLRELPDSLLMCDRYADWFYAYKEFSGGERLQEYWKLIHDLPLTRYNNLRYLMRFLSKVAKLCDENKMHSNNLAIVIGPNILWPPDELISDKSAMSAIPNAICESLITHCDYFFGPEETTVVADNISYKDTDESTKPVKSEIIKSDFSEASTTTAKPLTATPTVEVTKKLPSRTGTRKHKKVAAPMAPLGSRQALAAAKSDASEQSSLHNHSSSSERSLSDVHISIEGSLDAPQEFSSPDSLSVASIEHPEGSASVFVENSLVTERRDDQRSPSPMHVQQPVLSESKSPDVELSSTSKTFTDAPLDGEFSSVQSASGFSTGMPSVAKFTQPQVQVSSPKEESPLKASDDSSKDRKPPPPMSPKPPIPKRPPSVEMPENKPPSATTSEASAQHMVQQQQMSKSVIDTRQQQQHAVTGSFKKAGSTNAAPPPFRPPPPPPTTRHNKSSSGDVSTLIDVQQIHVDSKVKASSLPYAQKQMSASVIVTSSSAPVESVPTNVSARAPPSRPPPPPVSSSSTSSQSSQPHDGFTPRERSRSHEEAAGSQLPLIPPRKGDSVSVSLKRPVPEESTQL